MPSAIEPLTGNKELDNTILVGMVNTRWERGRSDYQAFYTRLPSYYNTYKGAYTGKFHPYRNNVGVPLLYAAVQTDVALKVSLTMGRWPIVEMQGYGPEDASVARKNEILISAQMKDCNSFVKGTDYFLSCDLYGTGVAQTGWKKDVRKMKRRQEMAQMPGQSFGAMPGYQIVDEDVTFFDGPDWNVIDLLDVVPAANSKFIPEMDYFLVRYWLDLDQIEALGKIGFFEKSAVAELKERGPATSSADEFKDRRTNMRSPQSEDAMRTMDKYSKPVRIIEMWGRVPSEMSRDGVTDRVVTVAEGKVLLRNEPNPFWDGEKPFIAYSPTPDPHYFFAPGKIEIGEKMQYTVNRLSNQKLDAIDLELDPVMLYDKNRFTNKQELYIRSGKALGVDGDPREVMSPLVMNMSGVGAAYQEIEQLREWIEHGLGVVRDTIGGQAVSKRQTAREFQGRSERSMGRLEQEARLAEEQFVEPLANKFRAYNRQFLTLPKVLRILGEGAVMNPITGQPEMPEPPVISLSDIHQDYDVRAVGASQSIGKMQLAQNLILAIQAIGATPGAQILNWPAVLKQVFLGLDIKNVDEMVVPPMMGMGMPGMPGMPPGMPPGPGGVVPGSPSPGGDHAGQPGIVNPGGDR
jgi:hypothetical protein